MQKILLFLAIVVILCLSERSYIENPIQYNPQGELEFLKVFQSAAEKKGGSVVGVKFSNALLIAAARRQAGSIFELSSQEKVMIVDKGRILVAFSGLLNNKHQVTRFVRQCCSEHALVHSSPVPIYKLCQKISSGMHESTTNIERQPLALNMLIAGYDHDEDRFLLYSVHPDGSFQEWKATAIGYNRESITTALSSLIQQSRNASPSIEEMWPEFTRQVLLSDLMIDKSKSEPRAPPSNDEQQKSGSGVSQYSREKDFEVYCLAKGEGCMEWRHVPWSDVLGDSDHSNEQ